MVILSQKVRGTYLVNNNYLLYSVYFRFNSWEFEDNIVEGQQTAV